MRNETDWLRMSSSENPPATKRHKNRHKREALRKTQKGKGRCAKKLGHIGQQASGEDGIRTRGRVLPRHRFSKPALSATQPPLRGWRYGAAVHPSQVGYSTPQLGARGRRAAPRVSPRPERRAPDLAGHGVKLPS